MNDLAQDLRLEDLDFYFDNPEPVLERLRREAPVFHYEPLDMWVISRYEDVRTVGKSPGKFSNCSGILINDFKYGDITKAFFPEGAENFALIDPPRSNDLRKLMIPPFGPKAFSAMEERARELVSQLVDKIEPGVPVNWSTAVSEPFPLIIIALLLGLPIEDLFLLKEWSDVIIDMSAATDEAGLLALAGSLAPMGEYFEEKLAERRAHPQEDMLTTLETARANGDISNETVHMMLSGIMAAGNETNRSTMNGAVIALAEHPDQMVKLHQDPNKVNAAVEEFLRWVTPVRGFGRTAVEDTDLGGQSIKAGQRLYMLYTSANRDEDVFPDPHRFDIDRILTKTHLSFGFGQHSCVGSGLARMELRVLFDEVARRFGSVEVDSFKRQQSLLQNAWSDVNVTFQQ